MITESAVVNTWIRMAQEQTTIHLGRRYLLDLLVSKFPSHITEELRLMIEQQNSPDTLETWFQVALKAAPYADFLRELRG